MIVELLLKVLGRKRDSDLVGWVELAALALFKPLSVLSYPRSFEVAEVVDQGLKALHETLPDHNVEVDGVNFPADGGAPLELARKGVHEVDCHVELLQVELSVVVVDIKNVEETLDVVLYLCVEAGLDRPVLDSRFGCGVCLHKLPSCD